RAYLVPMSVRRQRFVEETHEVAAEDRVEIRSFVAAAAELCHEGAVVLRAREALDRIMHRHAGREKRRGMAVVAARERHLLDEVRAQADVLDSHHLDGV